MTLGAISDVSPLHHPRRSWVPKHRAATEQHFEISRFPSHSSKLTRPCRGCSTDDKLRSSQFVSCFLNRIRRNFDSRHSNEKYRPDVQYPACCLHALSGFVWIPSQSPVSFSQNCSILRRKGLTGGAWFDSVCRGTSSSIGRRPERSIG